MKKGDFIYVPQNTRFLKEHEGRTTTDRTEQPLRGIWLASTQREEYSKIFLNGDVVYVKTRNIYEWRENVRSSESGEGFRPQFFSEEGLCKH